MILLRGSGSVQDIFGCGSTPMGSHFGVGAPPILVHFSGDGDVHWGYGILTHGHLGFRLTKCPGFGCGRTRST